MRGKRWWTVVTVCGVLMIGIGLCLPSGAGPEGTLAAFAEALRRGDQSAAAGLLVPEYELIAREDFLRLGSPWEPTAKLKYRVQSLQIDGDTALAEVWLSDSQFSIWPKFTLVKLNSGKWRIREIGDVRVDPRWETYVRDRQRAEGEAIALEIARRLGTVPDPIAQKPSEKAGRQ